MREYRRDQDLPADSHDDGWTPCVLALVLANVVVYVAMHAAVKLHGTGAAELYDLLAFVPARAVAHGHRYWQLATYAFVHDLGNPFQLLIEMYVLWLAGRELEHLLGKVRFLRFYLLAVVAGALAYAAATVPTGVGLETPLLGSSSAVMALLAFYALLHPHDRVSLFFFLDVPVWAGVLFLASVDVVMTFELAPSRGVAAACHLGGAAVGVASWRFTQRALASELEPDEPPRLIPRVPVPPQPRTPSIEDELDRVLQKVHENGLSSLTPEEKSILDRASKHYRERK